MPSQVEDATIIRPPPAVGPHANKTDIHTHSKRQSIASARRLCFFLFSCCALLGLFVLLLCGQRGEVDYCLLRGFGLVVWINCSAAIAVTKVCFGRVGVASKLKKKKTRAVVLQCCGCLQVKKIESSSSG